ncbi:desmoplakin [Palpita vitrealis nucleopolyhedrovirus]|uniref:Desmoplakin n=1 Tax=Palpita vitrealis nucleopolyhedrovirus TaxID=2951960 RepID=A0AAE9LNH2_9ABAC|nr:desmoplakin [Palpita vitrealis nucleopolyhedrovirus]
MQRWPKYGGTDVNTRTVHDLLNTINSMSTRIKTLEQYEHALREIHKMIVILKPSANTHIFEPNALPALIMQFLSETTNRESNSMTHNINYKYDYNFPYAPTQGPVPGPVPPAMQPPFPPNYSYYPPYPFSSPPPQTQTQIDPSNATGVGGSQTLNQITLTNEEESQLSSLLINMQTNISWETVQNFVQVLHRIVRVHIINNVNIINVISSILSVRTLIDYNFTQFIDCVAKKTNTRFEINQYLCPTIVTYIEFFNKVSYLTMQTNFTFTTMDQLIIHSNQLYNLIQQNLTTAAVVNRPVETVNDDLIVTLQTQLKNERILVQQLTEQNENANEQILSLTNNNKNLNKKYNNIIESKNEFAEENSENVQKIRSLEKTVKELNFTVQNLEDELNEQKANLQMQKNTNRQLNQRIESFNQEIELLQNRLQSGKNSDTKQFIENQNTILELKSNIEMQNQTILEKNSQITQLNNIYQQNLEELNKTKADLLQMTTNNQQTINELNNTQIELLEVTSNNRNLITTAEELNNTQTQLLQITAENETLKAQTKDYEFELEKVYDFVNDFSKIIKNIDQDYELISDKQSNRDVYNDQINLIKKWLQNLGSRLSNTDLANLQSANDLNEFKQEIANVLPSSILKTVWKNEYGIKSENVYAQTFTNDLMLKTIRYLNQLYESSQQQNVDLKSDFAVQINNLERLIQQNKTDFESISEFITQDPSFNRNLNDERFQSLKQQYDEASSKCTALETIKIKELESIADQAVKSELSKLNTEIDQLNSLFVKYNRKAQDIFEWKTNMLKRYETLARTTANNVESTVE